MYEYDFSDVIVAIHGFSPEGMPGARPPETVWDDRLMEGYRVGRYLEDRTDSRKIVVSGGGDFNGKSEAQLMYEWAEEEGHPITRLEDSIVLEETSENTRENVEKIYSEARRVDADAIFAVSSRDHVSRVQDNFDQVVPDSGYSPLIFVVGSDEPYMREDSLLDEPEPGEEPVWELLDTPHRQV